jgi:hypothetical protein
MLFDPKSGSMVAVPSREENSAQGNKNRKERGKKAKAPRERDPKREIDNDAATSEVKGGRRGKINNRKEDILGQQRGKGALESPSSAAKPENKKGKIVSSRKFPRTCGVLYSRDRKGNLYCVDGCDGDLGYGVHSVPGGRIKNSKAYSKYSDRQKKAKNHDGSRNIRSANPKANQKQLNASRQTQTRMGMPDTKETKLDWIKPNEKIELITGVEESPTLQATAREWAPTHYPIPDHEPSALNPGGNLDEHEDEGNDEDEPVSPTAVSFGAFFFSYYHFYLFTHSPYFLLSRTVRSWI